MPGDEPRRQLHMLLSEAVLANPPQRGVPAGYRLRAYCAGDEEAYIALMRSAGFAGWGGEALQTALQRALPDGIFFLEDVRTGRLVSTAGAFHRPQDLHPFGGELGWVATSPDHTGKGLGTAACAAVIERFRSAGYTRVYLQTDDWRLAAVRLYFRLGFVPFLYAPEMADRWRSICGKIGRPFTPRRWPRLQEGEVPVGEDSPPVL